MNSLYYFLKAKEDINDLYSVKMADWLFEEDGSVTNTLKANEEKGVGIVGNIKKGFSALINLLKRIIETFTSFLSTLGLSKEQRARFNRFRNYIKSNPELAHKVVTVKDWKAYEKMYGDIDRVIEEESKKENPSMGRIDNMIQQVEKVLKETGIDSTAKSARKLVAKISLDTLIDVADSNMLAAKALKSSMEKELSTLEELEKEVGAKEVARFKKRINASVNNGFLHRCRVKVFKLKEKTLQDIITQNIRMALDFTNIEDPSKQFVNSGSIMKGIKKHKGKAIKAAIRYGKDGMNIAKDINTYQDSINQGVHSVNQLGADISNGVKNAIGTGKKYVKEGKKTTKQTGRFFGLR